MELKIPNSNDKFRASPVYYANYDAYYFSDKKVMTNQGGTRSGKTYSIQQLLITISQSDKNIISVVSCTLPHLKRGAIRDFIEIMENWGLFKERNWNRTELIYKFDNGSMIEFFSADNSAKLRGPSRDVLFCNEVNLLTYDDWQQLILRTRGKIFVDYNPVDEFSWVYDHILTREDCAYIQSTYLDNYDFLPKEQIEEIERLKLIDENYWQVFGLGNVAQAVNLVYPKIEVLDKLPTFKEVIYGLDFGFHAPTALCSVSRDGDNLYIKELFYEAGVKSTDFLRYLEQLIPNKTDYIYADSADPQRIKEIYDAGFNIHKADKSVSAGIFYVKNFKLHTDKASVNLLKEIRSYKWKENKNNMLLDEPVKFNDHCCDSFRYAAFTHGQKYWSSTAVIFPDLVSKKSLRNKNRIDKYANY
jgi:phage terminase large subunit